MDPASTDDDLDELILGHSEATVDLAPAQAALSALALSLTPVRPRDSLRTRLLSSLEHLERFTVYSPRLAELLDLPSHDARRALHALERPDELPASGVPGMRALPLHPGPRRPGVRAVLACLEPGMSIPHHRHLGEEHILVYQGAFVTSDGRTIRAGEELHSSSGSDHAIPRVLGPEQCLCAIINEVGIRVLA